MPELDHRLTRTLPAIRVTEEEYAMAQELRHEGRHDRMADLLRPIVLRALRTRWRQRFGERRPPVPV